MAKRIPLTQGRFALVDDEDFERLNQWKWYHHQRYAARDVSGGTKLRGSHYRYTLFMHRVIMDAPAGVEVDHINHDGLDNRRCNLRLATRMQNNQNLRTPNTNKSGYRGVSWHREGHKWQAHIQHNHQQYGLGLYANPVDAARAYDRAARELFGVFANVNFADEVQTQGDRDE